jgi:hypothetical protein
MRIVLTFLSKYDNAPVSIPMFAHDKIHTDGSVTLSPTRLDGSTIEIPESRVVAWSTLNAAVQP